MPGLPRSRRLGADTYAGTDSSRVLPPKAPPPPESVPMYESALARQVLDTVLQRSVFHWTSRIRVVRGWVAETESLSSERLSSQFATHARGTPAEGARLLLHLIHVEARCRTCGRTYAPEHHLLRCPVCGSGDGEQLGQTGLAVTAIEVD
ncbi:hydrogenase maturation nickel metallochaperone HypA/HybF [Archangium violaceum]|uniref:hydrogenase maturation nickel metallochaperone HypA/HybF n=1 Tax=Archangium violaceum TaxID=83451 RepID=UPI0036DADF89